MEYKCFCCDYSTTIKANYAKHLESKKHKFISSKTDADNPKTTLANPKTTLATSKTTQNNENKLAYFA